MKQIHGGITAVSKIKAAGISAGIKKNEAKDMALIVADKPAVVAGAFTQNRARAACVYVSHENLQDPVGQAIIVNSGNANACTGEQGFKDAQRMIEATANALKIDPSLVFVASTGVIGQTLPMDKVEHGIEKLTESISYNGGDDAAEGILTTDLNPKKSAVEIEIGGIPVRIGGIAKGSGMIHPNMATMLSFITTDVDITPDILQMALRDAVKRSFNSISVDGDTSTNDTVLVLATGDAGNRKNDRQNEDYEKFVNGLTFVSAELAKMIVRDGEGATKLIEVLVKGAKDYEDADKTARAIANSLLVKTAIFGKDANWGRIVCAIGYSGAEFDLNDVSVWIDELQLVKNGVDAGFSEEKALEILGRDEITIKSDLGTGGASATIWTCDLSDKYIEINAAYRS